MKVSFVAANGESDESGTSGRDLRRAATQTATRWRSLTAHSDTQAVPAFHCMLASQAASHRMENVPKARNGKNWQKNTTWPTNRHWEKKAQKWGKKKRSNDPKSHVFAILGPFFPILVYGPFSIFQPVFPRFRLSQRAFRHACVQFKNACLCPSMLEMRGGHGKVFEKNVWLSCARLRGYPLSRYMCRATRVAADFLDFIAFCRCSSGVALHPLEILVSHLSPPPFPGGVTPKFGSEKVSRYTGVSQLQLRVSLYTVQLRCVVWCSPCLSCHWIFQFGELLVQ